MHSLDLYLVCFNTFFFSLFLLIPFDLRLSLQIYGSLLRRQRLCLLLHAFCEKPIALLRFFIFQFAKDKTLL